MGISLLKSKLRRHRIAIASVVCIASTGLASAPALADSHADAEAPAKEVVGKNAKPIEQAPPPHPKDQALKNREAWVVVSYCIRKNGKVRDVLVEDSSGVDAFDRVAVAAVEKWRFEPATLAAKPTEQCVRDATITFEVEASGEERELRRSFETKYARAQRARDREDLETARRVAAELAELESPNMYEISRLAILEAGIAHDEGDEASELRHLRRALRGDQGFIDEDLRQATLQRIFVLEVTTREYAEALATHRELLEAANGESVPEPIQSKVDQIHDFTESTDIYVIPARIGGAVPPGRGRGSWSHTLLRRTVGFAADSFEGIEEFDIRCDFHRAKGAKPRADRAMKIPEEWGRCRIHVFGRPGTEFQLVEYGADL